MKKKKKKKKKFVLNRSNIASYFPKASASFTENLPISSRFLCASFPNSRYPEPSISGVKEEYPRKYSFNPKVWLSSSSRTTAGRNRLNTYDARENLKPALNRKEEEER